MTAPNAFLVDLNSTITPRVGIAVDSSGAGTLVTVDNSGNQVLTPIAGGGGGGGGGGSGTVKSVNARNPDGAGNVQLDPLVLNALGVPVPWDPNSNTPTITSGVVPPGDLRVINAPYPGVPVSISPYITTVQTDDYLYWDGSYLRQFTAAALPRRVANYTPSTPYSGFPAESSAVISLNLGALAQGSRVMLKLEEYGNGNSNGQTMKVYLNGVQIFSTTSITFVSASPSWCWDLDFVVASLTRVHGSGRGVGSSATTSNLADKVIGTPTISSTVNTITVTMTNAASGPAGGVQYIDATVFN